MLKRQLVVPVSSERLWEALTDPLAVSRWIGATVDWELRAGGGATFLDDGGSLRHGRVEEVLVGRYLRFCWWTDGGEGASEVTYQLEPDDGGTRLTVVEVPLEVNPAGSSSARGSSVSGSSAGRSSASCSTVAAASHSTTWTAWDSRLSGVWASLCSPVGAARS